MNGQVNTLSEPRCQVETALRSILAVRERELLDLKGPCSNRRCRLHHAHFGPCDCG